MSKFYVTTSIPYANGAPHLGHAMEFVQGDVLARYQRQRGSDVILSTGTDEHGSKVLEKANENGIDPQQFVDETAELFKKLAKDLNVSYDRFIRTTDKQHVAAVKELWKKLSDDIYKDTYKGYYDVGEERFVSESEAKANGGISPENNRPYEMVEEENYFFKLSAYTDRIIKAIEDDELQIVPVTRKNEIINLLKSGLEDVSFSRPKEKVSWGVPVPGDKDHVMYVWPDALGNYLTVINYPKEEFEQWWPADVQVIGKNILRFHAAIWPAMLLSLGLPLPKKLYVHGFVTVDTKKMGKSLGNAIDPHEIISEYGADAFRYYFLRHIPSHSDGDFSWQKFERAYNSELGNDLGNLVQRLSSMVLRYQNGVIGEIPGFEHDEAQYHLALRDFRFDKALDVVWEMIQGLNQYLEETKPWQIAKTDDKEHLQEVLAYAASSTLQIADLLTPFLPDASEKIQQVFTSGVVDDSVGLLFPKKDLYTVVTE